MPVEAKLIIDGFRPYAGGNDYLWAIHHLNIADKHKIIITTSMKVGSWSITLDQTTRPYNFNFHYALKPGDVLATVGGNHQVDKKMTISADLAFGEPPFLTGEPVFPFLGIAASFVEEILHAFA